MEDFPAIPDPPPAGPPGLAVRGPGWRRRLAILALVLVGIAGLAGGGAALHAELTRPATASEAAAAGRTEIAARWARWPAGQIFPAAAPYVNWDGLYTTGYRVGISRQTSCEAALDPPVAEILRRHGCAAVLRATYVDQSGSQVATVGVAVMPSVAAALAAVNSVVSAPGRSVGLRAAGFPGTWSDLFGDAQRGWFGATSSGPYAYFFAAGYTDGRPGSGRPGADYVAGPGDLGNGVLNPLGALHESAALAKLPLAAAPGPQVAAPGARLAAGPVPGAIHAVHHSTPKLAGLTGVMAAGLILLCSAFLLFLRGRRRPPAARPGRQGASA